MIRMLSRPLAGFSNREHIGRQQEVNRGYSEDSLDWRQAYLL